MFKVTVFYYMRDTTVTLTDNVLAVLATLTMGSVATIAIESVKGD